MIREAQFVGPDGWEVALRSEDGKVKVTVKGQDQLQVTERAQKIEAMDAVIQAVIPLLRAVRNGLSKRVYASLDVNSPLIREATMNILREAVMSAISVDDVELLSMIPTRTHTPAP